MDVPVTALVERRVEILVVSQFGETLAGRRVDMECRIGDAVFNHGENTDSVGRFITFVQFEVPIGNSGVAECDLEVEGEFIQTTTVDLTPSGIARHTLVVSVPSVTATLRLSVRGTAVPEGPVTVVVDGLGIADPTASLDWGDSWELPELPLGEYYVWLPDGLPDGCAIEPPQSWNFTWEWTEETDVVDVGVVCAGQYIYEVQRSDGSRDFRYVDENLDDHLVLGSRNSTLMGWGRTDAEFLIRDLADCSVRTLDLDGEVSGPLTSHPARHALLSPDGKYLAIAGGSVCNQAIDTGVRIIRLADDTSIFFEEGPTRTGGSWSSDGVFAYTTNRLVILWDSRTERPRILADFQELANLQDRVRWSPEGSRLLVQRQEVDRLIVLSADSGDRLAEYDAGTDRANLAYWHPSGEVMIAGEDRSWNPETGDVTERAGVIWVDRRTWFGLDDAIGSQGSGFNLHSPIHGVWTPLRQEVVATPDFPGTVFVRRSTSGLPW